MYDIFIVLVVCSGTALSLSVKGQQEHPKVLKGYEDVNQRGYDFALNIRAKLDRKNNERYHNTLDKHLILDELYLNGINDDIVLDKMESEEEHKLKTFENNHRKSEEETEIVDSQNLLVKPDKTFYTTLLFKAGCRILKVERSEHDEIETCQIITDDTGETQIESGVLFQVTEDEISDIVRLCSYLDEFRATGRKKRQIDIVFPGTKWCGPGRSATSYEDLGRFEEADICCRKHDSCPDGIESFQEKYGLFNAGLIFKSLCTCDDEFYSCLKSTSDPIANTIGTLFFNIVSPDCIEQMFPQVCVRRGFLGRCLEYEEDTTAEKMWVFQKNERVY